MRAWRFTVSCVLFLAAYLFFGASLYGQAQVLGKISGVIMDSSGAVIPQAHITVTNKETGQTFRTTTNDSGYYVALNLPAGTYRYFCRIHPWMRGVFRIIR